MAMKTVYTVGNGMVLSENRSGVKRDYSLDPLGNTRALYDSTLTRTDTFDYFPSGTVAARTGTNPTPFQWNGGSGYFTDSSSRKYVRARNYFNSVGRWAEQDPIGFDGGDFNLYRYCGNRFVTKNDPSGNNEDDIIKGFGYMPYTFLAKGAYGERITRAIWYRPASAAPYVQQYAGRFYKGGLAQQFQIGHFILAGVTFCELGSGKATFGKMVSLVVETNCTRASQAFHEYTHVKQFGGCCKKASKCLEKTLRTGKAAPCEDTYINYENRMRPYTENAGYSAAKAFLHVQELENNCTPTSSEVCCKDIKTAMSIADYWISTYSNAVYYPCPFDNDGNIIK